MSNIITRSLESTSNKVALGALVLLFGFGCFCLGVAMALHGVTCR